MKQVIQENAALGEEMATVASIVATHVYDLAEVVASAKIASAADRYSTSSVEALFPPKELIKLT